MDIMLEITKTIIGVSLLGVLMMYSQFLVNTSEYKALIVATGKLWGDLSYSINSGLRGALSNLYQWEDNLRGVKVHSVRYF